MSIVTVHHGDSRSGRPLHLGIRAPMAGLAQRHQVQQVVGLDVVGEEPKRSDVVNILTDAATVLAGPAIPVSSLPLLRRPVRAAMMHGSPLELWVQFSNAVSVPAFTGAELIPAQSDLGLEALKPGAAADTDQVQPLTDTASDGRVLAGWGAVFPAPVLRSRRRHDEVFSAVAASNDNTGSPGREDHRV